jgi:hypothetical protein
VHDRAEGDDPGPGRRLNLGGAFAAIVAIVPTGRPADYQAAVSACDEAGTPLLTEKASTGLDCPTVPALKDATTANVDNNLWALLVVGIIAIIASVVVAWKDGTLADGDARRKFWRGFGWAFGLWLAVLIARWASLQWVIKNAHWIAAVFLFICIFVVGMVNALQVKREQSGDFSRVGQPPLNAVGETVGELIAVRRHDWYIWTARLMLLVGGVTLALWWRHVITLFVLEGAVFVLFMVFWTVQTFELERSTKPAGVRRRSPPATSTSTDVQDHANS